MLASNMLVVGQAGKHRPACSIQPYAAHSSAVEHPGSHLTAALGYNPPYRFALALQWIVSCTFVCILEVFEKMLSAVRGQLYFHWDPDRFSMALHIFEISCHIMQME